VIAMTFEDIGLRKLKNDAKIESIHIFNYIASKHPLLWKELCTKLEADLIYTNLVQSHKDNCLDKVRVKEAFDKHDFDRSDDFKGCECKSYRECLIQIKRDLNL
jgi:hypothetical protein